ncbi:hypothetical protein [Actinoplanes siamensis]|uniref:Uncharacterized protein n=1 Tax=Actinoplanes siamensis TaxID=1223317 RepID=A0A919NDM7_9ACTN|nr:hypothetical protein [Actinoplanes siamensis]GIF08685.1 hypothetical protein Asi03nite_62230 [Actinoplanes siamensis]
MSYCCAEHDWIEDDWYDDEDGIPAREEPDYCCWDCEDSGIVTGASGREVNCPECRPTPRQERRRERRIAWTNRRWRRRWARLNAGREAVGGFDDEAPF